MQAKNVKLERIEPERTDEELQKLIEPILLEYFEHGIVDDVMVSLAVFPSEVITGVEYPKN